MRPQQMTQQSTPSVRHYAARPCLECGRELVPTHGNQRLHEHCKAARQAKRDRRQEALKPNRRRSPHRPAPRETPRVHYAADFLRALPALKAELERVAPLGARLTARDYRTVVPTEAGYGGRRRND